MPYTVLSSINRLSLCYKVSQSIDDSITQKMTDFFQIFGLKQPEKFIGELWNQVLLISRNIFPGLGCEHELLENEQEMQDFALKICCIF